MSSSFIDWSGAGMAKTPSEVVVGNRMVTLEEVGRVACLGANVALDSTYLALADKNALATKPPKSNPTSPTPLTEKGTSEQVVATAAAPVQVCRAALLAKITSLMHAKAGVRSCVIQLLRDMLEAGAVPALASTPSAGWDLIACIEGAAEANFHGAGSLLEKGLEAVELTSTEKAALCSPHFLFSGAYCLMACGASQLSNFVDIFAALSSEAIGIDGELFDVSGYESCRQHRGQIASATVLQQMLQGSKMCGNGVHGADLTSATIDAFALTPQIHGPAVDVLNASAKAALTELNSFSVSTVLGFDETQSKMGLVSVSSALEVMAAASAKRCGAVLGTKDGPSFEFNTSITDDLGFGLLVRAAEVLVAEMVAANKALDAIRSPRGEEVAPSTSDATTGAAAAVNDKKPVVALDDGLDDATRAKIEAKRKAKADKAAAKAAAKAAKKGGGGAAGPPPGVGSFELRKFLFKKKPHENTLALNPFNNDEVSGSFVQFCRELKGRLASSTFRKLGIPPGTRDFTPQQMRIREQVLTSIRRVFKRHGAVEIDTPVFELRDILMGKYGEDTKLIYDLADQGGELLCMRYDLTVPFARFLAMNSVGNIKRFHIAKVYRRDAPQMKRGRYREFYQCDFDVAGTYPPLVPDAEVLSVACEILRDLKIGNFVFKLNHRGLLDAIFEIAGVPEEKFRPICSAVDKLDKMSWNDVKCEMVEEKGLADAVADKIGLFVRQSAEAGKPYELLATLMEQSDFKQHPAALSALKDMKLLMDYLDAMGSLPNIQFDMSLARGLDYYTGVIYEAVLVDGTSAVGSISAGGRYDNLVGMFSSSNQKTPCVGVSIGVERVFTIIEQKAEAQGLALEGADIQVYVAAIEGFTEHRMKVAKVLWDSNISAEYSYQAKPKLKRQLDEVLARSIPFMVVFGESEIEAGVVNVKDIANKTQETVKLENLVSTLTRLGCKLVTDDATSLLN